MTDIQPLFIVVVTNARGEGKTTVALLMQALLEMNGARTQLIDGDAGNLVVKSANRDALVVGWYIDSSMASTIVERTRGTHVILDLGANALASGREIANLLPALRQEFERAGYRTVALLSASTNRLGAVEGGRRVERILGGLRAVVRRSRPRRIKRPSWPAAA